MAVFERKDTTAVVETESFSESEAMAQTALADTSTNATFNSAFSEAAQGGSQFQTSSTSNSIGASLILVSGGGGNSSSNGSSSSWLQGQRDSTEQAAQNSHSAAANQAAARVNAARTGMRMATASESMDVTTKIITNHNHTHALTMQYWEVQRMYDVTTTIDGLILACLVPMQVVRFMPPGQPSKIADASELDSRPKILERYANILGHLDVLLASVPRPYRNGLNLLSQFSADPTAMVDASGTVAEDVIKFEVNGSFLSCETVSIRAVTKRNTRVGPVQLSPSVTGQPPAIPQNQFASRDDLVAWLTQQRQDSQTQLQGSLALPSTMNRSDIVGFEIIRQFKTVNCTLVPPLIAALAQWSSAFGVSPAEIEKSASLLNPNAPPPPMVTLESRDLENLVGGPQLGYFYAAIEDFNAQGKDAPLPQETYASDSLNGTVLPPQPFPVPALQIAPVLRYKDILEIEKSAQHVVRNTTRYSRSMWMSMSAEERVILLDGYTIGVPPGGLADAAQMIPLLNCVQNTVLGTFGNSLIMPFIIPQDVAEQMGIDPAELQQTLLSYQKESFNPPHSTIALPTQGVLGEAVLGQCASAEKIDLTRFWNWQDAPADTAPGIGMVQLPTTTPSLTTGVTAPNSLTNLPPLINNLIAPPTPGSSLAQALGQNAAGQQDFSTALTGQQQLGSLMQNSQTLANSARASALQTTQALTSQAITTVGNIVSSAMGGGKSGGTGTQKTAPTTNTAAGGKGSTPATPAAATPASATPASAGGTAASTPASSSSTSLPASLQNDPLGIGSLQLDPSLTGGGASALGAAAAGG
jgi:hypothetical protein